MTVNQIVPPSHLHPLIDLEPRQQRACAKAWVQEREEMEIGDGERRWREAMERQEGDYLGPSFAFAICSPMPLSLHVSAVDLPLIIPAWRGTARPSEVN